MSSSTEPSNPERENHFIDCLTVKLQAHKKQRTRTRTPRKRKPFHRLLDCEVASTQETAHTHTQKENAIS
jgi:hypothetical protein